MASAADKRYVKTLIDEFLDACSSPLVQTVLTPGHKIDIDRESTDRIYIHFVFSAILSLNDPFINSLRYEKGEAYIHLSKEYYLSVDRAAKEIFGARVAWNNTSQIGWLTTRMRY